MVKGITWDPIGKYIASQSVDKTLRIWRTSDWTTEHVVKEPFVDVSNYMKKCMNCFSGHL